MLQRSSSRIDTLGFPDPRGRTNVGCRVVTTPAPTASVVIPTFNRRDHLPGLLAPLLGDAATLEVIVVVDGCDDGSLEWLEARAATDARIRPLWQENAGQGVARAAGLTEARGDVVLFLDDDVVAGEGLVSQHVSIHGQADRLVVVGYMPIVLPTPRRPGQAATHLYARDYEETCRAYEDDSAQVLLNLWLGNCSLRRDDAVAVGMMPHDQPRGHEDREFGLRCLAAGLEGRFDRSLHAQHLHERSVEQLRAVLLKQAAYRRWLSREHPDQEPGWVTRHPPSSVLAIVRPLARDPAYRWSVPLLISAIKAVGRMHLWAFETFLTRILRQVEMLRSEEAA